MTTTVSTDAVIGFRLAAHHLTERVGARRLADAAGQCAIQDSPPGSVALALHARVGGLTREGLATALDEDATLLRTWSLRGAPFVLPTADAAIFTTGVLPPTEGADVTSCSGPSSPWTRSE